MRFTLHRRGLFSAACHKLPEYLSAVLVYGKRELRVPLHGPDKFLSGQADSLHQSILRHGHCRQTRRKRPDGLMVQAVDRQRLLPQQLLQRAARRQRHGVHRRIVGVLLVLLLVLRKKRKKKKAKKTAEKAE